MKHLRHTTADIYRVSTPNRISETTDKHDAGVQIGLARGTILQRRLTIMGNISTLPRGSVSQISGVERISLKTIHSARGSLTVCQWNEQLPFVPRRIFFQHAVPNEHVRGAHAHKECVQVLVCICGQVNVLLDDGFISEEFTLRDSKCGLLIPPGVWASQSRFSQNAVVAVFASHDYEAEDYIREYSEYLTHRRQCLGSAA